MAINSSDIDDLQSVLVDANAFQTAAQLLGFTVTQMFVVKGESQVSLNDDGNGGWIVG